MGSVVLGDAVPRSSRLRRAATCAGVVIALAAAQAIVAVPHALGDLYLRFRVPAAHPGQTVVAFFGDRNGRPSQVTSLAGIRAYLVPASDRISPRHQTGTGPPKSSAWLPLGPLRKTPDGSALMRFRLPADLAPGLYTIGFWCIPCAPPKGATFTGAYPNQKWKPGERYQKLLHVVALKPEAGAPWKAWEIAAFAVAAVTAGVGAFLYRRRHCVVER
jgi:hypothetical protein